MHRRGLTNRLRRSYTDLSPENGVNCTRPIREEADAALARSLGATSTSRKAYVAPYTALARAMRPEVVLSPRLLRKTASL
ncbi:hypothetical protein K523DRAFT_322069 [Schizophyllum commune Tattone D]|nr:hypothetical protein K523DRAFT_322069 [Schizophyllum commune Tattone D]